MLKPNPILGGKNWVIQRIMIEWKMVVGVFAFFAILLELVVVG